MNYVVIEIQTTGELVTSVLNFVFSDRAQAESKYHTILAYAAVGNLFIHSAVLLAANGQVIMHDSYRKDEVFNTAHLEQGE